MRLSELIQDLPGARVIGDANVDVRGVSDDSRAASAGQAFVAVRGLTVDGHKFLPAVIARNVAAVVVETESAEAAAAGVAQVIVPHTGKALGWLAQRAVGRPADQMAMIGITGTNGKTTTTFVLESILLAAGGKPGVIGTVSYRYPGKVFEASFTTPTPLQLAELMAQMQAGGCSHVVMEATSSALHLDRLEGVKFRVGAFTNLTLDHLDVHGNMAAYFEAKARLFAEKLAPGGAAVAIIDDLEGYGAKMLARAPAGIRRLRVTIHPRPADQADVAVVRAESSIGGIRATIRTPRGELLVASPALLGEFNVSNLALAVGVAEALELPHEAIADGIARLPGVPGRVERVANPRGLDVFVDYAHTPDALERVIQALRPLTRGRLICVFGCGGDRDTSKRPKMGKIAADLADLAVVTSDNPRTEEPHAIIDQILVGVRESTVREATLVEVDRRRAIATAVASGRPGQDVVLIAGKGHEDYQILGKEKIHFDDREVAAEEIARLSW
jgi:UDP-N-acetylmuramoyl-L-alanyl-D-glutamate--2,6-diaminopimelate ligase